MAEKQGVIPKTQRAETTPASAGKATSPTPQPTLTQKINTQEIKFISMASKNQQNNS
jgi:hypothetical protein